MATEFLSGKVVLHQGDARAVLRSLAGNSFDACVTDPPYALSFMGKEWDVDSIVHQVSFWRAVRWSLKPGAHLVAFGGTRTFHRMVCAIEDAGFEIRDTLMWLYGCLSEDSEILTEQGWKLGIDIKKGDKVAAWDATTNAIFIQPVEEHICAPYKGNLVRFVNDDTDQALTPDHRVYYLPFKRTMRNGNRTTGYDNEFKVTKARHISRSNPIKFPVAGHHDGPGIGGIDYAALLAWVWTEGGFDKNGNGVRIYQSESANPAKVAEIDALVARTACCPTLFGLVSTHKRYDRCREYVYGNTARTYDETCWFFSGDIATRVRSDLPDKKPSWNLLWRMTQAEKIAFLDAAMKGDGSGDDFYQKDQESLTWFQALLATVGQRGKIYMRPAPRDGGSVCITPRATTELQMRHLRNASLPYDGMVWCVKVATGAFVARRNGKVFITGNSGFPKSHDVSKAIDKVAPRIGMFDAFAMHFADRLKTSGLAQKEVAELFPSKSGGITGCVWNWANGANIPTLSQWNVLQPLLALSPEWLPLIQRIEAEREVIAIERRKNAPNGIVGAGRPSIDVERNITAAATDDAIRWDGFGTALKPACEPIVLARKPLSEGTVAANVLRHGCGALNIDGCRVEADWASDPNKRGLGYGFIKHGDDTASAFLNSRSRTAYDTTRGRWPANLLHDGSEEVKAGFPETASGGGERNSAKDAGIYGAFSGNEPVREYDANCGSAARFFYTAKADSDERIGSKHPTVKPLDLMQWLCRLVCVRGGTILDCFAGTGTTGEAAWREGMRCVLIENEEQYCTDIARRMELALAGPVERAGAIVKAKDNDIDLGPLFGGKW